MKTTLFEFSSNDTLKETFESDWFYTTNLETDKADKTKLFLSMRRLPKKDKMVYVLVEQYFFEGLEFLLDNNIEFETEEEVIKWFKDTKEEAIFKSKHKGLAFGSRYFMTHINGELKRCVGGIDKNGKYWYI